MSLLVRGARVVTASDDYVADVFADGETITTIGRDLQVQADVGGTTTVVNFAQQLPGESLQAMLDKALVNAAGAAAV